MKTTGIKINGISKSSSMQQISREEVPGLVGVVGQSEG